MIRFVLSSSLLCSALSLLTATVAAQQPALQPGQVDTQKSRAYAHVGARGLGHEHGVEGRVASGTIRLGVAQEAGRIVFDMKSFVCDTDASRKYVGLKGTTNESTRDQTTANMLGASILDVANHPAAVFTIRSSLPLAKQRPNDPDWYELSGDFTLHGVTRPLVIKVVAQPEHAAMSVRGQFVVKQTDYGITPFSKALGAIGVADEVRIFGDLSIGAP